MKSSFKIILTCFLLWIAVFVLDKWNVNSKDYALKVVNNEFNNLFENIDECAKKYGDEILVIEKTDIDVINSLTNWGINNIKEIFEKKFIVNNTGWYWIVKKNHKLFVIKLKSIYPVNNQYLKERYISCLKISDDYKLDYNINSKQIFIDNAYIPLSLSQFPKYKSIELSNINALLYIAGWIALLYLIIIKERKLWIKILFFIGLFVVRWLLYKFNLITLLNESVLFDVQIFAFPKIYFLQSFGDVMITSVMCIIFSNHLFKQFSSNKFLIYVNVLILIALLIICVYLFTHHASFSLNLLDVLVYDYQNILFTILSVILLLTQIMFLGFAISKYIFQKDSLYYFGLISSLFLLFISYLIFYFQKIDIQKKVDYVFEWFENEEQLAMFEQIQLIENNLSKIKDLNDSVYFNAIAQIENNSIFLQLSKRYLFEDTLSLVEFLKNKKMLFKNVFLNDNKVTNADAKFSMIDNIYYLNVIDKKYLLSVFDYIFPLTNQSYYSFLNNKIFQRPTGFKDFNVASYQNNILHYKLGDIQFPYQYSSIISIKEIYSDYAFYQRENLQQNIIVAVYKPNINTFLSLFSTYFIIFITFILIGFYFHYALKFKQILPFKNILYSYKITGLVLFILVVSFYMLFIFSFKYIDKLLNVEINNILLKEMQDFNENKQSNNILIYNKNGQIHSSSVSNILIRFKLLPNQLSKSILSELKNNDFVFSKRQIGKYAYTSLFANIQFNNEKVIVEFPFYDEINFYRKNLSNLLSPLFNIYALLFFISIILGVLLSNYIVLPIQRISLYLKQSKIPDELNTINYFANDELGELVNSYNHLILSLKETLQQLKKEQQEKAWKLMAQQIAHDIKNSLTPLQLNIEYLQMQSELTDKQKKILDAILFQTKLLSKTADDFSQFAQDIEPNFNKVNLITLIHTLLDNYSNYNNVQINFNYNQSIDFLVMTDEHLLSRVIVNLLNNAIEAIQHSGKIDITLSLKENKIILSIQDNGEGIPVEIQDKIFEPKFSTKSSGKGLGLSIVKNICEKLGITISFESAEGKGTIFYLVFN